MILLVYDSTQFLKCCSAICSFENTLDVCRLAMLAFVFQAQKQASKTAPRHDVADNLVLHGFNLSIS